MGVTIRATCATFTTTNLVNLRAASLLRFMFHSILKTERFGRLVPLTITCRFLPLAEHCAFMFCPFSINVALVLLPCFLAIISCAGSRIVASAISLLYVLRHGLKSLARVMGLSFFLITHFLILSKVILPSTEHSYF